VRVGVRCMKKSNLAASHRGRANGRMAKRNRPSEIGERRASIHTPRRESDRKCRAAERSETAAGWAPAAASSYMPLIVTFVAAPSTRMTAAFGVRLSEPRLPFLIAPLMLTLAATAPPVRLTGRPPMVVQGQRLLATETVLPPTP